MTEEKKLTYDEVYTVMNKPSKSEEQVHEEVIEFLDRTQGPGNYEKPIKIEIDSDELEDVTESLAYEDADEQEVLDDLIEQYGKTKARVLMDKAKYKNSDDFKYYQKLDEDERRVLKKLQRHHPDQGWNAQKYLKNTK